MSNNTSSVKLNEIDQAWVDALRSGKHKQGTNGYLCEINKGERYECCLGVLLNIREDPTVIIDKTKVVWEYKQPTVVKVASLPAGFLTRSGLFTSVGGFRSIWHIDNSSALSLGGLNDSGHTFAQIADFIEAFPWVVFRHYDEPDGVEFDLPVSFGGGKLVKIG